MAGRPKLRALEAKIRDTEGGEDSLFERVADGEAMRSIAKSFGCSRPMLYQWAQKTKTRKDKFDEARKISAHSYVEDGQKILDSPLTIGDHSGEASLRGKRAEWRRWLAGVRNAEYRPEKAGVNVNVNSLSLGAAHLDALKRLGTAEPSKLVPTSEKPNVVDAEIIEE